MKKQNIKYYLAGSISLITFIVYLASLQNAFVLWDDEYYVFENPYIRTLDFAFLKWAFFDFYAANWHPLTWISHALDYAVWGLNPLGHHLTNNILHAVNTFIVVLLVAKLMTIAKLPLPSSPPVLGGVSNLLMRSAEAEGRGGNRNEVLLPDKPPPPLLNQGGELKGRAILIAAATTGLLFGLHPVHVESVAWVAERKDLLCALFYLLSIMMYSGYVCRGGPVWPPKEGQPHRVAPTRTYIFSLAFFILALMSKPMAVSLPAVLLILDWHPFGRIASFKTSRTALVEKLPFIAFSLISSVFTIMAQEAGGSVTLIEAIPLSTRFLVAAKSLVSYLWKMLVPVHLLPYYPYPKDVSFFSLEYLSAMILAAAITTACIVIAKRQKLFLSVWTYYVVTLIPVLGFIQVGGQSMADRYTYLPGLGPFLIMGLMIVWITEKIRKRPPAIKYSGAAAGIFLLLAISLLTWNQIGVWKNSITLWTYVIEKGPTRVPVAYNNRGLAFFTMGEIEKATGDYHQAIALDPRYAEAHSNLGVVLSRKGLVDDAIRELQIAVRLSPGFANAHRNLAPALLKSGRIAEALEEYLIVTTLRPEDAGAHADLGSAYGAMGSYDKAIEHFQIALRLRPDFADAHYNLGIAYQAKGMMDQTVVELEAAARLNPEDAAIRNDLARAYSLRNPAVPSK